METIKAALANKELQLFAAVTPLYLTASSAFAAIDTGDVESALSDAVDGVETVGAAALLVVAGVAGVRYLKRAV